MQLYEVYIIWKFIFPLEKFNIVLEVYQQIFFFSDIGYSAVCTVGESEINERILYTDLIKLSYNRLCSIQIFLVKTDICFLIYKFFLCFCVCIQSNFNLPVVGKA